MIRLAAVIPSAGLSSRMGQCKPLLSLGNGTVLSACVNMFRSQGIETVFVVTGKQADDVAEVAREVGAIPVYNPNYEQGMYTSVRCGVSVLSDEVDAFFMLPVDIPLVRSETIARMAAEFEEAKPAVLYPRFCGERGHPPLVDRSLIPSIVQHDGTGGLRSVLQQYEIDASDLDVADFGVSYDLDRPADYDQAKALFGREYPCPEECDQLFAMYGVHEHIVGHCRAVARVAVALAKQLNSRSGPRPLDLDLVRGAALTHDIGKGSKRHEEVGAELLRGHGFHTAAGIVRDHFDMALAATESITEKHVVFLADKLVRCDRFVPLEERYLEKMKMYADEPGVPQAIAGRLERARTMMARFDQEMDVSSEQVAREALA